MPPDAAHAEAHRRLVEVLAAHRWVGASCSCGVPLPTGIAGHLADVVLDLFPVAEVQELHAVPGWIVPAGLAPANARQLVLRGALEPVTGEPCP